MIGILKPDEPPKNLITKGQAKTETDCLAYDECPDDYISGVRGFAKTETDRRRQGAIYGSKPVKRILVAAHSCKCCYRERKYDEPRHLAVEHFRPKTAVRQSNKHKEQYPGYYWLAYDWDNLLLSCHECNSDWKGIFFPLANPRSRALSHHDDYRVERPLLINPALVNPRGHIRFYSETPAHKTRKGEVTIEVIGLRRPSLREARLKYLAVLKRNLDLVEVAKKHPTILELKTLSDEAQAIIDLAVLPDAPFSSMVIDYLSR